MKRRIAILRGINVGGKRKILMADLKAMFEEMGFSAVKTYIQSGNVLFTSDTLSDNQELSRMIEEAIQHRFGFEVPVIIRTSQELEDIVQQNPFWNDGTDINRLHLTFLNEEPTEAHKQQAESYHYEVDKFAIIGKEVFIYCDGKYHQSKLTNTFFEKKLNVKATTRNWKTVRKLLELSKQQ